MNKFTKLQKSTFKGVKPLPKKSQSNFRSIRTPVLNEKSAKFDSGNLYASTRAEKHLRSLRAFNSREQG